MKALGNFGGTLPWHYVLNRHRDVPRSERGVNQFTAAFFGEIFGGVGIGMFRVAQCVYRQKTGLIRLLDAKKPRSVEFTTIMMLRFRPRSKGVMSARK